MPHPRTKDLFPEQTAIAEGISDMGAELVAFEQRRDKIRTIKQRIKQEFKTNQIRFV